MGQWKTSKVMAWRDRLPMHLMPVKFSLRGHESHRDPILKYLKCPSAVIICDKRRHGYPIAGWQWSVNLPEKGKLGVNVFGFSATIKKLNQYLVQSDFLLLVFCRVNRAVYEYSLHTVKTQRQPLLLWLFGRCMSPDRKPQKYTTDDEKT